MRQQCLLRQLGSCDHVAEHLAVPRRGLTVCSSPAEAYRQSCSWSSSLPALQRAEVLLTLGTPPAADCGGAALAGHHLAARQPPDVLQHLAGERFGARTVCRSAIAVLRHELDCVAFVRSAYQKWENLSGPMC